MKVLFILAFTLTIVWSAASENPLEEPGKYDYLLGWTAWSEWSECSKSCGGGQQSRVRTCEGGNSCEVKDLDIEKSECNEWECFEEEWAWGEWSPCEDGWYYRERCGEDFDCEFEEEECGVEDLGVQQWSEWGECDGNTGRRSRERCGSQFGCEIDEQECGLEDALEDESRGVWGVWGPCVQGLKTRKKCEGMGKCTEEEVMHCGNGNTYWSDWGECVRGTQERSKCDPVDGCESQQRPCGGALVTGSWSNWGSCKQGFRSRKKCNGEGKDCQFEEKECGDGMASTGDRSFWTEELYGDYDDEDESWDVMDWDYGYGETETVDDGFNFHSWESDGWNFMVL